MKSIEVKHISKSFRNINVVNSVNFSVEEGEIYGLIGPDGAGKTTILRMIIGGLIPEKGEIEIENISSISNPELTREKLGYMPQAYGLYGDLTVVENMKFFGMLHGISKKVLIEKSTEILEFVKLEKFRDRKAGALSGGMYKKLAIACSIIHSPKILVLDEPTNGVDPVSRRDLWSLLFSLSEKKVSVLISTPYMDEAERCHKVGLLFDGNLLKEGSPRGLISEYKNRLITIKMKNRTELISKLKNIFPDEEVYTGGTKLHILFREAIINFGEIKNQIIKSISLDDLIPAEIKLEEPTFEDVFMNSSGVKK